MEIEPTWVARLLLHSGEEFEGPQGHLWALAGKPLDLVPAVQSKLVELLKGVQQPITRQQLLGRLAATSLGREHKDDLDDTFVAAILRLSRIEIRYGLCQLPYRQ